MEIIIKDIEHMQQVAKDVLKQLKDERTSTLEPVFLGLSGELGSGKTTFTRHIAELLGVTDVVVSPTFILRADYETKDNIFQTLVHIDVYRLEDQAEAMTLGWDDILKMKNTLVIIEWPENIDRYIPKDSHFIKIDFSGEIRKLMCPFAI